MLAADATESPLSDGEFRYEIPLAGPLACEAPRGVQYDLTDQSINQSPLSACDLLANRRHWEQ